ncbi:MAG: hypothetical protein EU539_05950 [Promethearchaeota archaeon]|nr:MAG: hypothetical protein EU539_05950 [Candidatus Lokiarchaeota archaeon]
MKTSNGGVIDIDWTSEETGCPCGAVMWTAEFSVDEPIVLASNHVPDVLPDGCEVVGGPDNLGKWVCASICSQWCGCCEPDQQFWISGCITGLDVEPGKIIACDTNIPEELPVCITNSWLADKYITLCVYGGYEPIDGQITLLQDKTGKGGDIDITWTSEETDCPCGAVMWTAHLSVADEIVLDANAVPDAVLGPDGEPIPGVYIDGPDDLGKWVSVSASSLWQGCTEADQQFVLIPAHKSFVPEFPTLDERYIASSNVAVRMTSLQARILIVACIFPFIIKCINLKSELTLNF